MNIEYELKKMSDEKYRSFISSLIPGVNNILGVRRPKLRSLAKEISKNDWRNFFLTAEDNYFEELMLQSMVIGYVDVKDVDEWVGLITDFIPKINNWSICDTFCVSLKQTQLYKKEVWELIKNYFHSEKEYEVRFSIVMVIFYFIECPYLEEIYKKIDSIKHDGYYVKMAIAWAISIAYIKFPRNTLSYLKNNNLDLFTYNMALQKIIESRQVESIKKDQIRTMKRSSRIN